MSPFPPSSSGQWYSRIPAQRPSSSKCTAQTHRHQLLAGTGKLDQASSCTFARSPHSGICRHQASRDGVALEHPRATPPCFLRMLSYMRVHWPRTGSMLVPRGFPSPGACQKPVMGPWGCPSPQVRVSWEGFLGVQIPPQPLLTPSLPDPPPGPTGRTSPASTTG